MSAITDEMWGYCCAQTRALSANYRLLLIHIKILHRLYRTPVHLHKMGLRAEARCERCGAPDADFIHLAWTCWRVAEFWDAVYTHMDAIVGEQLTKMPLMALSG